MKNIILLFLVFFTLSSCEKDEAASLTTTVNPSIKSVRFMKSTVGSTSYIKVELTLDVPEKGSLARVDFLKGTTRVKNVLTKLETGTSSFVDGLSTWPEGATPSYYVFILVLANGTEIASSPYEVK